MLCGEFFVQQIEDLVIVDFKVAALHDEDTTLLKLTAIDLLK